MEEWIGDSTGSAGRGAVAGIFARGFGACRARRQEAYGVVGVVWGKSDTAVAGVKEIRLAWFRRGGV